MITIEIHDTNHFGASCEIIELPGRITGRIYRDVIKANLQFAAHTVGFRRIDAVIRQDGEICGFCSRSVAYSENMLLLFDICRWNYRGRDIASRRRNWMGR